LKYELWTDGACNSTTKVGSWAFVIVKDEKMLEESSGKVLNTTNNRMELQAVIKGLKRFSPNAHVEVISDSAYVVDCFKNHWYVKWRKMNWHGSSGKEVKNRDLWEELLDIVAIFDDRITWTHVRGHAGHQWNELCDQLASRAMKEE